MHCLLCHVYIGNIFLTKPKIECVWHHEAYKHFNCIAMDALSSISRSFLNESDNDVKYRNTLHYVHVALFCFSYHGGSAAGRSTSSASKDDAGSSMYDDCNSRVYSIDIGGDELERKQMEVRDCVIVMPCADFFIEMQHMSAET